MGGRGADSESGASKEEDDGSDIGSAASSNASKPVGAAQTQHGNRKTKRSHSQNRLEKPRGLDNRRLRMGLLHGSTAEPAEAQAPRGWTRALDAHDPVPSRSPERYGRNRDRESPNRQQKRQKWKDLQKAAARRLRHDKSQLEKGSPMQVWYCSASTQVATPEPPMSLFGTLQTNWNRPDRWPTSNSRPKWTAPPELPRPSTRPTESQEQCPVVSGGRKSNAHGPKPSKSNGQGGGRRKGDGHAKSRLGEEWQGRLPKHCALP